MLADAAADVALSGPRIAAAAFIGMSAIASTLDGATFERDTLRVGTVVVILPVDLERDEIVLIRQFRLGAQLALGLGDLVEVPAGRVERGEDVADAARRECQEEIGVAPRQARAAVRADAVGGRRPTSTCSFFSALVDAAKVPERAGAAHEQERHTAAARADRPRARGARRPARCITARRCSRCNGWRSTAPGCREIVRRAGAMSAILAGRQRAAGRRVARGTARPCQRHARCALGRARSAIRAEIAYACVWNPPHGLLAGFPNLRAIINLGAGVDHLLADPALPPVPIARVAHAGSDACGSPNMSCCTC